MSDIIDAPSAKLQSDKNLFGELTRCSETPIRFMNDRLMNALYTSLKMKVSILVDVNDCIDMCVTFSPI